MKPKSRVFREADIKFAFAILKNANAVTCQHVAKKLVAGARFELATFRL